MEFSRFDLDKSEFSVEYSSPIEPSNSQVFAYWALETQLHLPFFILQLVTELHPTVSGSPSIPHSSGKFEYLRVTSITFSLNLAKPPFPPLCSQTLSNVVHLIHSSLSSSLQSLTPVTVPKAFSSSFQRRRQFVPSSPRGPIDLPRFWIKGGDLRSASLAARSPRRGRLARIQATCSRAARVCLIKACVQGAP